MVEPAHCADQADCVDCYAKSHHGEGEEKFRDHSGCPSRAVPKHTPVCDGGITPSASMTTEKSLAVAAISERVVTLIAVTPARPSRAADCRSNLIIRRPR